MQVTGVQPLLMQPMGHVAPDAEVGQPCAIPSTVVSIVVTGATFSEVGSRNFTVSSYGVIYPQENFLIPINYRLEAERRMFLLKQFRRVILFFCFTLVLALD